MNATDAVTIDSLCVFKHNTFGITTSGTGSLTPLIASCSIDSNATGIYCETSSPQVENNNLRYNTGSAILCANYSYPLITGNLIVGNGTGVRVNSASDPDIGHSGTSGQNYFHLSDNYHVNNTTGLTTMAEDNWWGFSTGPKPSKINGSVDYTPWLTSAPFGPVVFTVPPPADEVRMPKVFALGAIVPNPFNPTTTIHYDVPRPGGRVTLRIYDVSGRLVTELVNGSKPAGFHSVTWSGTARNGNPVATGVYFARMVAPSFSQTKKLILLK